MDLFVLLYALVFDTSLSWLRMLAALAISILLGLFIGIYAAVSPKMERIIIPVLDVLQTLPILAFFPFAIYIIVAGIPGYVGINVAVIALIVTSMLWNIAFGAYEAVKSMPAEYAEMSRVFRMGRIERLKKILVPGSMPKVVDQAMLSWAIGLFYLVTSEVFSTGSAQYAVRHGIGVELINLAYHGTAPEYALAIAVFIAFVIATRFLLFGFLEWWVMRRGGRHRQKQRTWRSHFYGAARLKVTKSITKGVGAEVNRIVRAISPGSATAAAAVPEIKNRRAYKLAALVFAAAFVAAVLVLFPAVANDERIVIVSLAYTLGRVWLAFAAVLLVSVPLGVYVVFISKTASRYITAFQILASIPATVLLPVIVMALRGQSYSGELVAFLIFFLSGVWYMLFSIVSTRSSIGSEVSEVRRVFNVKGWNAFSKIYVLAILPGAITGGITAIAAEWNASIVAERFTSTAVGNGTVLTTVGTGLGKLLDVALANGQTWLMLLGLINLTVVIIVIDRLLWRRLYNRIESVYR